MADIGAVAQLRQGAPRSARFRALERVRTRVEPLPRRPRIRRGP